MCFSGGGDGGAGAAAAAEAQRQQNITDGQNSIDAAFAQFNPAFYANITKAYQDYQDPSFNRQTADAQQQLEYGLDRAGIENSTAGDKARGDLNFQIGTQQQAINDQATQAATDQQTQVENARSALVSQLNSDANAGAAASGAAAHAATLALMPTFSPIGTLFQNVTGNLSAAAQGTGLATTAGGTVGAYSPAAYGATGVGQVPTVFNSGAGSTSAAYNG